MDLTTEWTLSDLDMNLTNNDDNANSSLLINGTELGDGVNEANLYEVPTFVVVILSLFYGIISLTAFVGNSLVIYVVVVSRRMRTVTNMYIANLAFADVTIALFAIPFQFHAALLQRWDLPAFMCQFCPTVQILSVNISIFTLVAISLDRYRAIMYPLKRKPTKLISKVVIIMIWICGFLFALPMAYAFTYDNVPESYPIPEDEAPKLKPFCYIDFSYNETHMDEFKMDLFKYYSTSLLTVQYFLPMAIISVAYSRIAFRLWGSKTPGAAQDERDHIILANKKKVIKMLLIVVCIFSVCWLPWQTYMVGIHIYPEINEYRYINIIFFCCHWLAMSNSCYNPFIYGVYSEKFRKEFADRLPCLRCLKAKPKGDRTEQSDMMPNSGIPGHTLHTNVPIRGRQNYGNGNGNGRVALLNHRNDLELSVPRNRNNREMIKIEVHKPENKMFLHTSVPRPGATAAATTELRSLKFSNSNGATDGATNPGSVIIIAPSATHQNNGRDTTEVVDKVSQGEKGDGDSSDIEILEAPSPTTVEKEDEQKTTSSTLVPLIANNSHNSEGNSSDLLSTQLLTSEQKSESQQGFYTRSSSESSFHNSPSTTGNGKQQLYI